ncbi:adenylyltransferase/cytidyltransferase family protein [Pseudomonas sp. CNPSo 3701]|uniref:adenylyltransferase/cytidyltransferase family protein n=1 Tax=Pseudomonas sp. CNPSo 3701 TaxID=3027943 RepID=UPI00236361D8|nr:adenylyltransferase/cytidyltransferase family protein [Pseudomonas sp. CNPSo 3701]MDD1509945.1 adenylyltransferase/cytidyltransferase family protein [Pseudomonas sp. CNPSo 3701]
MQPSPLQCFAAGQDEPAPQRFALAVYGGAFDPPHAGHASVIRRALETSEQVLVVPSYRHADAKRMADFDLRCAWVERLAARFGDRVRCCSLERELGADGRVIYSVDLLSCLAERYGLPGERLALVIGEDNLTPLKTFHRAAELRQRFGLVVADEEMTVHSSAIRAMIAAGQAIPEAWQLPEIQADMTIYRSAM